MFSNPLETNRRTRAVCGSFPHRWRNWPQVLVESALGLLLRCPHKQLTRPITPVHRLDGTYVVCLDCGTALAYDWQEMRVIRHTLSQRRQVPSQDRTDAAQNTLA